MRLFRQFAFISCLLFIVHTTMTVLSLPIDQAYPSVFAPGTGINVTPLTVHGINGSYQIQKFPPSESNRNHWDERGGGASIKYLILHYTVSDFRSTVDIFTKNIPDGRVSAHYVVTEREKDRLAGGRILQVVPEGKRAWHAGVGAWQSDTAINALSIGIEHVNKGFTEAKNGSRQWYVYDTNQMRSTGILCKSIVDKYGIRPENVLGHEDIAPGRKSDPGPLFDWATLYREYGVGAWLDNNERSPQAIDRLYKPKRPCPTKPDRKALMEMLYAYGYRKTKGATDSDVIRAFKHHFSQNQNLQNADDDVIRQEDMFVAWALEAKYVQK